MLDLTRDEGCTPGGELIKDAPLFLAEVKRLYLQSYWRQKSRVLDQKKLESFLEKTQKKARINPKKAKRVKGRTVYFYSEYSVQTLIRKLRKTHPEYFETVAA